jgi:BolA family transcriptional regulator, general stress-responsive regulator
MKLGKTGQRIARKLQENLRPSELEVIDESGLHAGHSGWRPGGETHFRIRVRSAAFEGRSRLERHRIIHHILDEELAGSVHALAIEARSSNENKT